MTLPVPWSQAARRLNVSCRGDKETVMEMDVDAEDAF